MTYLAIAGVFAVSCFVTWRIIPFLRMDYPNERSSHVKPVPRGGGLAIVAVFLLLLLFLTIYTAADFTVLLAGGAAVAAIGFVDDARPMPTVLRFILYALVVAGCIYHLGAPSIQIGSYVLAPVWGVYLLEFLVLLWVVNFFNFMDGIDAIASIEAVSIAATAALILGFTSPGHEMIMPLLCLTAATAGFVPWNYPPARVFMGDVASGFLGLTLGLAAIITCVDGSMNLWTWFILFGAFFVDASVTMLRRIAGRRPIFRAHRDHAYQHASLMLQSRSNKSYTEGRAQAHRKVSATVAAINFLWLLPLAFAAAFNPQWGTALTVVALLPLIVGAVWLGAGSGRDTVTP